MRHYFLGNAANYSRKERLQHTFTIGHHSDRTALCSFLAQKYQAKDENSAILTKNGRSALCLALKSTINRGSTVIVNGFTCHAVLEAIKAAGMKPAYADINTKALHFDAVTLKNTLKKHPEAKAIIVQNTLGIPIDITTIEQIAKKHGLIIIEDLAHCTGVFYPDGRECGTVGAATALSFGKDKSIDTVTGGAVIFRSPSSQPIQAPSKSPKFSDVFRARFYPLFGAINRAFTYVHLSKLWMNLLLKLHLIERSADSPLDLDRRIPNFVAKLALIKFKKLPNSGRTPLRSFYFVNNRDAVLKELRKNGYYFDSLWYEKPISPIRYYSKTHFPEDECPIAVNVASSIINLPTYYKKTDLKLAIKIIEENQK